jgi:hypothetical protein
MEYDSARNTQLKEVSANSNGGVCVTVEFMVLVRRCDPAECARMRHWRNEQRGERAKLPLSACSFTRLLGGFSSLVAAQLKR